MKITNLNLKTCNFTSNYNKKSYKEITQQSNARLVSRQLNFTAQNIFNVTLRQNGSQQPVDAKFLNIEPRDNTDKAFMGDVARSWENSGVECEFLRNIRGNFYGASMPANPYMMFCGSPEQEFYALQVGQKAEGVAAMVQATPHNESGHKVMEVDFLQSGPIAQRTSPDREVKGAGVTLLAAVAADAIYNKGCEEVKFKHLPHLKEFYDRYNIETSSGFTPAETVRVIKRENADSLIQRVKNDYGDWTPPH